MSPADFTRILYEKNGPVAHITINRPERMNAVDDETSRELYEAFYDFRWNNDLRVAILTGAGDRSFSAGADLVARAKGEKRPYFGPISFGGITKDNPIYSVKNMEIESAKDMQIDSTQIDSTNDMAIKSTKNMAIKSTKYMQIPVQSLDQ